MSETSTVAGEVRALLGHLEPLLAGRRVLVSGSPGATDLAPPFDRIVIGPGDLTWDGRWLGAGPPAARLLLCGDRPSGLRGATVVALPPGDPGEAGLDQAAAVVDLPDLLSP